ncbi:hypothetical protein EJ08DRAFT_648857 [Tothia fuscella]|uniref:C2H2-type domain-containing protein n=1 Tax=Tothia fuscella TaxID=1048955 RepID=A0A9P4U066_9PEZI|nr:hypothetical protein EJ08DRAFT_648857 [Tothia fuscella]
MSKRTRAESHASSSDSGDTSSGVISTDGATPPPNSTDDKRPSKYAHTSRSEASHTSPAVMQCHLPPHNPLSFSSYEDYNVHYQQNHFNRCPECNRNFPSEHYLDLHIADNHNPLNEIRRERGEKTYGCFVKDCDRFCSTPAKRKRHAIDKHGFPKFYDFFIVNDGIDKRSTMLRNNWTPNRRQSTQTRSVEMVESVSMVAEPSKTNQGTAKSRQAIQHDPAVEALGASMSALRFVPRSVNLGRGMRAGFQRPLTKEDDQK